MHPRRGHDYCSGGATWRSRCRTFPPGDPTPLGALVMSPEHRIARVSWYNTAQHQRKQHVSKKDKADHLINPPRFYGLKVARSSAPLSLVVSPVAPIVNSGAWQIWLVLQPASSTLLRAAAFDANGTYHGREISALCQTGDLSCGAGSPSQACCPRSNDDFHTATHELQNHRPTFDVLVEFL